MATYGGKKGRDREEDKFEEVPITAASADVDAYPHRKVTGTASAVRVLDVAFGLDSTGSVVQPSATANLAVKVDENSGTEDIYYIGIAVIGSATSGAVWQIQRITVTNVANKLGVDVEWADGNDKFDNVYDNREALSYS